MGNTFRIIPFINVYKAGRSTIAPALVFIKVYKEVITADVLYIKQFISVGVDARESAINSINQEIFQEYLLKDLTTSGYHELLKTIADKHPFKLEKVDLRYYVFGNGVISCLVDEGSYHASRAIEFANGVTSRLRTAVRLAVSYGNSDLDMLFANPTNRMFNDTRLKLLNFDFKDENIAKSLNIIERDLIDLPQLRADDRIQYVKFNGFASNEPQVEQYK